MVHAPQAIELDLPTGTVFSVLAMHGPAGGVTVSGARWPLTEHHLAPLVGLGVSNVAAPTPDQPLTITVADGIVTVVVPGAAS